MNVYELHYSKTNTYLIEGASGFLLFDTGWAGTFFDFCRALGDLKIAAADIKYLLISHFHPDHYGIAQNIADLGTLILLPEPQKNFVHSSDELLKRDMGSAFKPILDQSIRPCAISESRSLLREIGIEGEILYTPGHSEDSISLWLDDGRVFVGDLNPYYELPLHEGTRIEESWKRLLALNPKTVYYGHAKTAVLGLNDPAPPKNHELYTLTSRIMKLVDKGLSPEKIQKKTGAKPEYIEDVMRMYLTHPGTGVQGILDRIELKGR